MKKFFIIILSLVLTLTIQAQGKPASFMGIPVSGSSNSMHEALTKKGLRKTIMELIMENIWDVM